MKKNIEYEYRLYLSKFMFMELEDWIDYPPMSFEEFKEKYIKEKE